MSRPAETAPPGGLRTVMSWCATNRHFLAAVVILGASAAGWEIAKGVLKIATRKEPVPWPAGVEVDDEFRMVSLPDRIGPYEYVSEDGEIHYKDGKPFKDGQPDGEPPLSEDVMELLGMRTPTDESNLPRRRSNWFAIRIYRDRRLPVGHPLRYWRLEVYYYTGGVDVVPHVPEICAVAGGATFLRSDDLPVDVPAAPAPWSDGPVRLRRTVFQHSDMSGAKTTRFVQYYVFSVNGTPESQREVVRLKLASPFVRYAYFAKIQFAPVPVFSAPEPAQADAAAGEFARRFLPHVLKVLPMPDDVEKLTDGDQ